MQTQWQIFQETFCNPLQADIKHKQAFFYDSSQDSSVAFA